jgi:protein-S-isoprenylcysteine O-methyltransferase Ste14
MRFLPLAGVLLVFAIAFCWRAWLQHRRHGHSGIVLFRSASLGQQVRDAMLVVLFLLLLGQAAATVAWPDQIQVASGLTAGAGTTLMLGGIALLVVAQLDLGASWRIGVDEGAKPGLVTGGLYRWTRNPIYLALLVVFTGYALLLPRPLSLFLLGAAFIGILRQVRAEERYLAEKYGEEFRDYARRVPRFAPGGEMLLGVVIVAIIALGWYYG